MQDDEACGGDTTRHRSILILSSGRARHKAHNAASPLKAALISPDFSEMTPSTRRRRRDAATVSRKNAGNITTADSATILQHHLSFPRYHFVNYKDGQKMPSLIAACRRQAAGAARAGKIIGFTTLQPSPLSGRLWPSCASTSYFGHRHISPASPSIATRKKRHLLSFRSFRLIEAPLSPQQNNDSLRWASALYDVRHARQATQKAHHDRRRRTVSRWTTDTAFMSQEQLAPAEKPRRPDFLSRQLAYNMIFSLVTTRRDSALPAGFLGLRHAVAFPSQYF